MPTAAQIDRACREGYLCYTGNRQKIAGAQTHYATVAAKPGTVWCHMWRTGLWEEVEQSKVVITNELIEKETIMPALEIVPSTGKKSGKRGGAGHTSLPSESAARAARKGDATSSLKDLGEIVAGKKSSKGAAEKKSKDVEAAPKERKPRAVVTRTIAKQGELPGVQTSSRKIVEIEDLADKWEDAKIALKDAREAFQDADDNLVASMRRHGKSVYSRATYGKVEVPDPKIHAKFKREKTKTSE